MYVIYQNKDERESSRETNSVSIVICTKRVSQCVEKEYIERFRSRNIGV